MLQKLVLCLSLWVFTTKGQCPPSDLLSPCRCDVGSTRIICTDDIPDLKAIFDRVSPYVDPDHVFNELSLSFNKLTEIPEGAIQTLKFEFITIKSDRELTYIHPKAFNATLSVTNYLTIVDNLIYSDNDVWELVNQFTNLTSLDMNHNGITSVPDYALGFHANLTSIVIGIGINLSYLGSQAFSNLPQIGRIDLSSSNLNLDEIAEDAFVGIAPSAVVNLNSNPFTRLPENIFKPLLDRATLLVGGDICNEWGCHRNLLDCDEVSEWICNDVALYQPRLQGFYCKEPQGEDIFSYCSHRNETTTTTEAPDPAIISTCGGILEANLGKIQYKPEENYENSERCAWIIRSPNHHTHLYLTKQRSGFEIGRDYLSIFTFTQYEHEGTTLGQTTNDVEERHLYGPVAVVVFTSDVNNQGQGFELDFKFNGTNYPNLNLTNDYFSSEMEGSMSLGGPGANDHYGNSQLSVFAMSRNDTYYSDIGWKANIRIYRMEEYNWILDPCYYDGIRVYSVALDTLSFVGKYCSDSEANFGPFLARNLYIFVLATSAGTDEGGFEITWKLR